MSSCQDLAGRLDNRIQLTTDGHKAYLEAVDEAFGNNIDYAMLIKIYGDDGRPRRATAPRECTGTRRTASPAIPSSKHVSTSYVERQNLTMRMHISPNLARHPAMAAGVTDRIWEISDIVQPLDERTGRTGPSKEAEYGRALGIELNGSPQDSCRERDHYMMWCGKDRPYKSDGSSPYWLRGRAIVLLIKALH